MLCCNIVCLNKIIRKKIFIYFFTKINSRDFLKILQNIFILLVKAFCHFWKLPFRKIYFISYNPGFPMQLLKKQPGKLFSIPGSNIWFIRNLCMLCCMYEIIFLDCIIREICVHMQCIYLCNWYGMFTVNTNTHWYIVMRRYVYEHVYTSSVLERQNTMRWNTYVQVGGYSVHEDNDDNVQSWPVLYPVFYPGIILLVGNTGRIMENANGVLVFAQVPV